MSEILLRKIEIKDLDSYLELTKPSRLYHKFNGPYFKKSNENELKTKIQNLKKQIENGEYPNRSLMVVDEEKDVLIGEVSWYWKSEETKWMEIGIVIFNEDYWGQGIGYKALRKWIDRVFDEHKDIVRLGLTTWSGNERMMNLAEKLGFVLEARYRKARIVEDQYYDSISYGILREEWENNNKKTEKLV